MQTAWHSRGEPGDRLATGGQPGCTNHGMSVPDGGFISLYPTLTEDEQGRYGERYFLSYCEDFVLA